MKAAHWMQIAALAAAMGLTGSAIAQPAGQAAGNDARSSIAPDEPPSAGAIVTPQDKALGMGRQDASTPNPNATREDDTSRANDDISVNPGTPGDDMSVNPGPSSDDMNVDPDARDDGTNAHRDDTRIPGSNVRPGDMGPQDMRGQ